MANFIFGILFAVILIPVADGMTQIILGWFELIKSYIGVKLTNNNNKIQASTPSSSNAIGFAVPEVTEEDWEDEEDDL